MGSAIDTVGDKVLAKVPGTDELWRLRGCLRLAGVFRAADQRRQCWVPFILRNAFLQRRGLGDDPIRHVAQKPARLPAIFSESLMLPGRHRLRWRMRRSSPMPSSIIRSVAVRCEDKITSRIKKFTLN